MGTRLQSFIDTDCIDALNLSHCDLVARVHREYLEAGADLLFTNTYGANAVKLARYGRADQVQEINRRAAQLAKSLHSYVGGSIGPIEDAEISDEEIEEAFRQQMLALAETDFLVLETFQDLREARLALKAAENIGKPVWLSVGGVQNGRTGWGADVREFAKLPGLTMLGANCRGPYDILQTIEILARVTDLPLFAVPNAGSPEIDRGRIIYNVGSEKFGQYGRKLYEAGVAMVGGCCGTDPSHIAQLAHELKGLRRLPRKPAGEVYVTTTEKPPPKPPQPNRIQEVFRTTKQVISVELRPGRTTTPEEFLNAGLYLADKGVHLFDVPDNAGAKVTVDPLWSASQLQAITKIPTIIHLSTSHRNLIATQSYLLGCWQAGIHGVLAVTGDHPNVGDHDKYASRVNDIKSSVNLIHLIHHLNSGLLFNDTPCLATNLSPGCGFNPVRGLTAQIKWLQRKIEAGAQYVYTQPVFREEDVDTMLELTQDVKIPILVGIMPLASRRNAEFFASGRIPGIIIPSEILKKFEDHDSPQLGLQLAHDLMQKVKNKVRGFYLLPPFGKDHHLAIAQLL